MTELGLLITCPMHPTETFLPVPGPLHRDNARHHILRGGATSYEATFATNVEVEAVDHGTGFHGVGYGRIIEVFVGTRAPRWSTFVAHGSSKGLITHTRSMWCGASTMAPYIGTIRRESPWGFTVLSASVADDACEAILTVTRLPVVGAVSRAFFVLGSQRVGCKTLGTGVVVARGRSVPLHTETPLLDVQIADGTRRAVCSVVP